MRSARRGAHQIGTPSKSRRNCSRRVKLLENSNCLIARKEPKKGLSRIGEEFEKRRKNFPKQDEKVFFCFFLVQNCLSVVQNCPDVRKRPKTCRRNFGKTVQTLNFLCISFCCIFTCKILLAYLPVISFAYLRIIFFSKSYSLRKRNLSKRVN